MNIFVTHPSPFRSAIALDDRRLIKMILETAQLLSTAVQSIPGFALEIYPLYKPTHANHPCSIWARSSQFRFTWLYIHGKELALEYTARFGKTHKSVAVLDVCFTYVGIFPSNSDPLDFDNCTPYKHLPVFEAYKQTLRDKWQADGDRAKWTNSQPPEWK